MGKRTGLWMAGVGALVAVLLVIGSCEERDPPDAPVASSTDSEMTLAIAFTSGAEGRLEPCGCTEQRWGGLGRRATALREAGKNVDRLLRLDVGSMALGPQRWERINLAFMAQALVDLQYDAVNLGRTELTLPADQLIPLAGDTGLPLVSTNVRTLKETVSIASVIALEVGGLRLGILGLVDPEAGQVDPSWEVMEPESALTNWIMTHADDYDGLIVLADLQESALQGLAARFPEVDLIVGGQVRQPSPGLLAFGPTRLAYVGVKARALGVLQGSIRKGRLQFDSFQARTLDESINEDWDLLSLVEKYNERLRNITQDEGGAALGFVHAGEPRVSYVGSEACAECHADAAEAWAGSKHRQAIDALVARRREANPDCLRCHTIGLGEPGGFVSIMETPELDEVGCESCHGPGGNHVTDTTLALRPQSPDRCVTCHDAENSPSFVYDEYWPKIEHTLDGN